MKHESKTLLQVEHLSVAFGSGRNTFKAVDDISFSVDKGEVFGLVGESGCGKTTTGRAVMGIYPVREGSIRFGGSLIAGQTENRRITEPAGSSVRRKLQMIFQDPASSLNPRMTVREIIAEGLVLNGMRNRAMLDEKVYEMLALVGLLREHAGRYPHEFSGGQRQRIGIARALIMQPEMLIADEPLSALDVSVQAQIINLLHDLRRKLGLTILFIAHDLSVVKYFCDRIAVMYAGKILETAPSDELFACPIHPYTKALLSAIPVPDPIKERKRIRTVYTPDLSKTPDGTSVLRELVPGHWVYCSDREEIRYREASEK